MILALVSFALYKDIRETSGPVNNHCKEEIRKRNVELKNVYYNELADNKNLVAAAREVKKESALTKKS